MKGVFDINRKSRYDDDIALRYHFPSQYRQVAAALAGDWILYRETRRHGGRQAYVAVAQVLRIEPDPRLPSHAYAFVGGFLEFDRPVPLVVGGRYAERPLRELGAPALVGSYLYGKSIRSIDDADFAAIVRAGLAEILDPANAVRLDLDRLDSEDEARRILDAPPAEQERRIVQVLTNRKLRDAAFRRQVREAYDFKCAVTGLRIFNGGGRPEVQAAHIWPVAEGGPDVVENGLALSGTAHWLFDRHLISLTDDYRLLVSHNKVPAEFRGLFERQLDRIHLPADRQLWPHTGYLAGHRERYMSA